MKRMQVRSVLVAVTLGTIGLILALFGSASLGLMDSYNPIGLIMWLYTLMPLLVLAMLLALLFGRARVLKSTTARARTAKILSILAAISFMVGMLVTKLSTLNIPYNQTRGQFVLENTGTAAIFLAFVFTFALIDRQNYVYWPLWSRGDRRQADERQLFVRQRVFEKAYRYLIFLALASALIVGFQASRMQKIAPFLIALAVTAMPAVVAAWQKES